jgi:hypothetical protein
MIKTRNTFASILLTGLAFITPALAAVTHTGKAVNQITVVTENNVSSTSSTSFADLPGASASIRVPAGKTQLVQVRFSAESTCFGNIGLAWCSIRILADGVEMLPNVGSDFAFDSDGLDANGLPLTDYFEGHSMDRTVVLGPGTHTIELQWCVTNSGLSFQLDDWTLTVTQYASGH